MEFPDHAPVVDHVRLRPCEQIAPHSHPAWELSLVLVGAGVRRMGDREEPFAAGDLVLVPPRLPHGWLFRPDVVDGQGMIENITVFFSDDLLRRSAALCDVAGQPLASLPALSSSLRIVGDTADEVARTMRSMVGGSPARRIALLLSALVRIAESADRRAVGRFPEKDRARARMADIDTFLRCNYARPISLQAIAARAGMTKSSFCNFFRRQTGRSFVRYVNDYRLDVACRLLSDDSLSVSDVCYRSGFNDIHYFSRLFKLRTGLSPRRYRDRLRGQDSGSQ